MSQTYDGVLDRIRDAVLSTTPASAVYLFGSRATGSATTDSDYDMLIVTDDLRSAVEVRADIRLRLRDLHVSLDLLLFRSADFELRRKCVNTIPYIATREGFRLDR